MPTSNSVEYCHPSSFILETSISFLGVPSGLLSSQIIFPWCPIIFCIVSANSLIMISFPEHLYNVGSGKDISIKELAETIQKVTGHKGTILWDASKPDGTPRKLLDVSKIKNIGWEYSTELDNGIKKTYQWFLENIDTIKEIKL